MSHMVNGTTTSTKMITSSASSSGISAAQIDEILNLDFDDLEKLSKNSLVSQQNIDAIIAKYTGCLENIVQVRWSLIWNV
jgi:hypothetical protein